ncbi:hypothetical protein BGX34_006878, partial [Mortierella sp. NVP85]
MATCGENFPLEVAIADEEQHQSSVAPSKRGTKRAHDDQDQPEKPFKRVQTLHSSHLPSETDPAIIQPISNEETTGINVDDSTRETSLPLSHMKTNKRPLDDQESDEGPPRDAITDTPTDVNEGHDDQEI